MRLFISILLLLITPAFAVDTDDKIYTDQDLKSRDYEHQSPEQKKRKIISSGIIEYKETPQQHQSREDILRRAKEMQRTAEKKREEILQQQKEQQKQAKKAATAGATILGTMLLLPLIVMGIQLILCIIALIDILRNEFTESNKLIWVLVVTFIPFIGPLLYFFIGEKHKKLANETN